MAWSFPRGVRVAGELAKLLGIEDRPLRSIEIKASIDGRPVIVTEELITDEMYERLKKAGLALTEEKA